MPQRAVLIRVDDASPWTIGSVDRGETAITSLSNEDSSNPENSVGAVDVALKEIGYGGEPLVLAFPSAWCLASSIDSSDLPRRDKEQAMLFRLEEKLPVSIEEVVADFLKTEDRLLGVAIEVERVSDLLNGMEARGINIGAIVPSALLALQGIDDTTAAFDLVVMQHEDAFELFEMQDGKPAGWQTVHGDTDALLIRLKVCAIQRSMPLKIACLGFPTEPLSRNTDGLDWTIESGEAPGNDSTIRTSCEIASGRLQPWLNLRRGALAPSDRLRPFRGPLMALLSTLCVALMCSAFALLWRSHHYERIRADHDGRQVELFRELFPGQSIPASVNSRLESEERKARGLSGQYADLPLHRPPLLLLSDTLSALPTSVRYRLLELRLTPEKLYIEGQTRSHSDAEIIVSSIRQGTDFQLDPPRTEQTKDAAIIFNVTGLIPASSPMRGGR